MVDAVKIATYIYRRYQAEYGVRIDEMKLHKMLYLAQRESMIQTGAPLFDSLFKAWKYGPVLVEIRQLYKSEMLGVTLTDDELQQYMPILDKVFAQYAKKDSWSLSALTHGEYSWKKARVGLAAGENGNVSMRMENIKKDAERVKLRRFLLSKMNAVASTTV